MAEMLLINPRKRRATRKAAKRPTAKRRVIRRKNPIEAMKRRRNPVAAMRRRVMRRRNPIAMGGGYMTAIREALMGGAGAVAMDVVFGQVNRFLPATLQKTAGTIGAGDAVKAVLTVFIGQALNKVTRGFSRKAAQASLTVQAHDIIRSFVPATVALGSVGYATPAFPVQGTNRVGPIRQGVNAYTKGTPLLNAYQAPNGPTALLSGARSRENVTPFR